LLQIKLSAVAGEVAGCRALFAKPVGGGSECGVPLSAKCTTWIPRAAQLNELRQAAQRRRALEEEDSRGFAHGGK